MADVLVLTVDGSGNVPPALAIGAELSARGHAVRVLGSARQAPDIAAAGLEPLAYRRPRPWVGQQERSPARAAAAFVAMVGSRAYGRDLADVLETRAADVVVVDAMIPGATLAATRLGVPNAVLMHTFAEFFASPVLEAAGRLRGFSPRRAWEGASAVLVASDALLDPAHGTAPPTFAWTGVAERPPASPLEPAGRRHPPRVLVSLSSVHIRGQAAMMQRILDGLAALPVEVVATTGPTIDGTTLRVPANATVHRHLPHHDVMPTCDLVVGHGGHSTTMRALLHGLPLLVLPADPRIDQPMVGRAVARAGAGAVLDRSAPPERIRAAAAALLGEPAHRAAALVIGRRLRAQDGVRTAADRVLALPG